MCIEAEDLGHHRLHRSWHQGPGGKKQQKKTDKLLESHAEAAFPNFIQILNHLQHIKPQNICAWK